MAYIDGVYKRLDEIIVDPRVPYEEVRERLRAFIAEEIRKSFWNGVKSGSGRASKKGDSGQPGAVRRVPTIELASKGKSDSSEKVTVSQK